MSRWNEKLQGSGMTERLPAAPRESTPARLHRLWRDHSLPQLLGKGSAALWRWLFYRPWPLQWFYRPWLYLTRTPRTFRFEGAELRYFYHAYNTTWNVERQVEVPIARHYLARFADGAVLEVGNVLAHYLHAPRTVVDKFETAPGVINVDILDYRPATRFSLVLAISTLEHVGWDDEPRDPARAVAAIRHLAALLAPGGLLLATLPVGYNPELDRLALAGELPFDRIVWLKRVTASQWREASAGEALACRYGTPFNAANAIAVGLVQRP